MRRVHQLDASDCGPACLAMIAGHLGRQVSMTQMRERAGTDRNSTNLKGLIDAAESVGLNAQAVKGEAGSLTPEVPVPCVAHVTKDLQYHFVVIYKIGKDKIWVADPDPLVGKTTYSLDEFNEMWTGYLVLVSRGENFRKGVESPGLFGRFLPTLKPHVGTIVNTVVASIVLTLLGIAGAFYFRFLVDEVLFSGSRLTLQVISIGVVVITLLQVVLGAVREHMLLSFSMKVDAAIILGFPRHLFRLPRSFMPARYLPYMWGIIYSLVTVNKLVVMMLFRAESSFLVVFHRGLFYSALILFASADTISYFLAHRAAEAMAERADGNGMPSGLTAIETG